MWHTPSSRFKRTLSTSTGHFGHYATVPKIVAKIATIEAFPHSRGTVFRHSLTAFNCKVATWHTFGTIRVSVLPIRCYIPDTLPAQHADDTFFVYRVCFWHSVGIPFPVGLTTVCISLFENWALQSRAFFPLSRHYRAMFGRLSLSLSVAICSYDFTLFALLFGCSLGVKVVTQFS